MTPGESFANPGKIASHIIDLTLVPGPREKTQNPTRNQIRFVTETEPESSVSLDIADSSASPFFFPFLRPTMGHWTTTRGFEVEKRVPGEVGSSWLLSLPRLHAMFDRHFLSWWTCIPRYTIDQSFFVSFVSSLIVTFLLGQSFALLCFLSPSPSFF